MAVCGTNWVTLHAITWRERNYGGPHLDTEQCEAYIVQVSLPFSHLVLLAPPLSYPSKP